MSHTQKVMADPKLSAHNPAHQRMSEPTGARALFLEAQRVDTEPIYSKSRRRTRQSAAFLPVSLRAPNKPLLERIVNPLGWRCGAASWVHSAVRSPATGALLRAFPSSATADLINCQWQHLVGLVNWASICEAQIAKIDGAPEERFIRIDERIYRSPGIAYATLFIEIDIWLSGGTMCFSKKDW
jgi:hypothetical protein